MSRFLGEFEVKLDPKGRMRLPSQLLKQLGGTEKEGFVLNRGFEKCLTLFTKGEWERITKEINELNLYVKKNRDFVRYFYRGATETEIDNADRLLIPKRLLEYAGIEKDIIVFAYLNKIELWAQETYEKLVLEEPNDFVDLAEEVMGKKRSNVIDEISD